MVHRVVHLQFPVGAVGVGDATRYDFHPVGGLVHRKINEGTHVAQISLKARHVCAQAAKDQTTVARQARQGDQIVILTVKGARIGTGRLVLDIDALS